MLFDGAICFRRRRLILIKMVNTLEHPNLYILRHGETVWNREGRYQGRKDSDLTELGEMQALRQRELLASISNRPSNVYVSPQGRAVHTARLALEAPDKMILDERLQEISFGDWEGVTHNEVRSQVDDRYDSGYWNFHSPNGETYAMISDRVQGFLDYLTEPAIIVTHGATSTVLRGICMGLNQTEILDLPKDQGCIYALSNGIETILR